MKCLQLHLIYIHWTISPAVNGQSAFVLNGLNGSPFMNLRMNNNNTPEQANTSSDTNSQNSNNLHHVKSEPLNDSTPQSTPQLTQPPPPQFQVHLPHFLASFPPHPTSQHPSFPPPPNTNGHNHLVPLTTTFPIQAYPPHPAVPTSTQQQQSHETTSMNRTSTITKNESPLQMTNGAPTLPSTINLPSISNHSDHLKDNNNDTPENINDTPQSTPAPSSHINRTNSPSGSRTSHETRNSVVFTPANHHKNSSSLSTNSNSPEQNRGQSKSPRPEKQPIHLPGLITVHCPLYHQ